MQTTQPHPLYTKNACHHLPGITEADTHWLMPGKVLPIAPGVDMGITYDRGAAVYKFWHHGKPIKNQQADHRHQLDLRTSLGIVITELCHRNNTITGHKETTCIEIAKIPLHLVGVDLEAMV